jgi:hypothetical protein
VLGGQEKAETEPPLSSIIQPVLSKGIPKMYENLNPDVISDGICVSGF